MEYKLPLKLRLFLKCAAKQWIPDKPEAARIAPDEPGMMCSQLKLLLNHLIREERLYGAKQPYK